MDEGTFSLNNKVAIVTGARRGIGEEIALTFAKAGADVVVCDIIADCGELEAVVEKIEKIGRRSLSIKCDISIKSDVDKMVKQSVAEFGAVDILVNNAGIAGERMPLLELDEQEWNKVITTNLSGYFFCSQAVGKKMGENGKGSIISLSSCMGLSLGEFGWKRATGYGVYSIAKAGVIMLTKVLSKELGGLNIRANAIAPGPIVAPTGLAWNNPDEERKSAVYIPLGRVGRPRDVATTAVFLASDASSFITGDTLSVDGGIVV